MPKRKSLPKPPSRTIVRDSRSGQFLETREALARPRTTVKERIPLPGKGFSSFRRENWPVAQDRNSVSVNGEPLPPRDPKTGSFTTRRSSAAISANVIMFADTLKRLAKK